LLHESSEFDDKIGGNATDVPPVVSMKEAAAPWRSNHCLSVLHSFVWLLLICWWFYINTR